MIPILYMNYKDENKPLIQTFKSKNSESCIERENERDYYQETIK